LASDGNGRRIEEAVRFDLQRRSISKRSRRAQGSTKSINRESEGSLLLFQFFLLSSDFGAQVLEPEMQVILSRREAIEANAQTLSAVAKQLGEAESSMGALDEQRAAAAARAAAGAELARKAAALTSGAAQSEAVAREVAAKCESYRIELDREMAECSDDDLAAKLRGFDTSQNEMRQQKSGLEQALKTAETEAVSADSALQKILAETANLNGKLSAMQEVSRKTKKKLVLFKMRFVLQKGGGQARSFTQANGEKVEL
jgi:hypothetical protein